MRAELDQYRSLTQGERQRLLEEFLIEYIYDSNAMEGNALTLQETALVLEGVTIDKKSLKDHLAAVGLRDAFRCIQELVKNKVPLSESIVKQIHTLVLMDKPEDRGVYRRIPVRGMGVDHDPPDPALVPEQMRKLMEEISHNKELHPIERAALFCLKFDSIHPFIDGNGRTGRLILNMILMQDGYPPVNMKFADRRKYYEALDAYYRDADTSRMERMILESMKGSHLRSVLNRIYQAEQ